MGSIIFSYLAHSLFFDPSLVRESFASVSDNELRDELERYRSFCKSNLATLTEEVAADGMIQMFAGEGV